MRRVVAPLLGASLLGCSTAASGPSTADAGVHFTNKATHHASYVPDSEHPTTAAQLIVIGDSISAGYGASEDFWSYAALLDKNDDMKWPDEKTTSLDAKFALNVPVLNVSHPGDTTDNLAAQQMKLDMSAPFHGRQIVTITIGGNDLQEALVTPGSDPTGPVLDNAMTNIQNLVTYLQDKTKFPDGTDIYLMTVYDPTDGTGHAGNCFGGITATNFVTALDTWRTSYIALGKQMGFSVVDALGAFHGHGMNYNDPNNQYYTGANPELWFYRDCIHPNDRGHNALRRLFFEAIDWNYVATP